MSETQIVNRTPETFGQKIERERLEAETVKVEYHVPLPPHVGQVVVGVSQTPETGYADHLAPSASGADQKIDREFIVPGTPGTSGEAQANIAVIEARIEKLKEPALSSELEERVRQILGVRAHAPRDPDLKEFKEQVIRAFKHIGLDTAKFFS